VLLFLPSCAEWVHGKGFGSSIKLISVIRDIAIAGNENVSLIIRPELGCLDELDDDGIPVKHTLFLRG
jgi:hypothetical protein